MMMMMMEKNETAGGTGFEAMRPSRFGSEIKGEVRFVLSLYVHVAILNLIQSIDSIFFFFKKLI